MPGGIGNSYSLSVTCTPSTAGQLSYLPASNNLPTLSLPLSVSLCGQGTEQVIICHKPYDSLGHCSTRVTPAPHVALLGECLCQEDPHRELGMSLTENECLGGL